MASDRALRLPRGVQRQRGDAAGIAVAEGSVRSLVIPLLSREVLGAGRTGGKGMDASDDCEDDLAAFPCAGVSAGRGGRLVERVTEAGLIAAPGGRRGHLAARVARSRGRRSSRWPMWRSTLRFCRGSGRSRWRSRRVPRIDFLRKPAAGSDLRAEVRLLKLGRQLAVADALIYSDGQADPVARASMTYSIPPVR